MKKLSLFLIIVIPFRLFSQANVYHPFPDSNAVWNQECVGMVGNTAVYDVQFFFLFGDTVIANVKYNKVFSSGYKHAVSTCCYYYNKYEAAIRQNTALKKIYYLGPMSSGQDVILYDFANLNLGDTLPATLIQGTKSNFISAIDSVLVGSTYRTQYHIGLRNSFNALDSNYAQLIEGIGGTLGLFVPIMPPGVESGCWLNCFSQNSIALYTAPGHFCDLTVEAEEKGNLEFRLEISPIPSTGIINITSSSGKLQYSLYDIFGKEILKSTNLSQVAVLDLTSYPKGIYFVRGKAEGKIFARKIILQ
jgi:hypothetical protein